MGKPKATPKQKAYLQKAGDRFGIAVSEDRLTFMDVSEAGEAISILKGAEKVADWLEEKALDF